MSLKISLAFLLAVTATLAKGQNNTADSVRAGYHIFFPTLGKDILAGQVGGHSYKIVSIYQKPAEVYVDDKKIEAGQLEKYDVIIEKIKAAVKDDEEERDMRDMARSRRQAERDERQAERDREQQQHDREQQQRDREAEQRNREQARRNREQSSGDETNWQEERETAQQREQAAEDRAMLKKGIQYLLDEHIIPHPDSLKTLVLTDTDISVNGIKQPQNVYQQIRNKLGDWARSGLSYDAMGNSDSFSLSIID